MHIVNVGYESTNYYVLADSRPRLLLDVGFPGTLPKMAHQCSRMGVKLDEIKHLLLTHYHPDHAGLAQELKNQGMKLIVVENQVAWIPALKSHMKPSQNYLDITLTDNLVVSIKDSRALLSKLGIEGEIIATPGHSDDSVTLVLDEGAAFTGDLPHPLLLTDDPDDTSGQSWAAIRALKVKTVYPGHGPVYQLD